jgi:hypothetical protein
VSSRRLANRSLRAASVQLQVPNVPVDFYTGRQAIQPGASGLSRTDEGEMGKEKKGGVTEKDRRREENKPFLPRPT